ncbi:hypothetical protein BIW11_00355 [Tropilaelaps mercedesae]|uniref:CLIP1 zinc knuckle domain-containing protein n=1 Tax=Tropilaelaps mercedesae TaxID=418985 RepID=A0A1V9XX99_9ACAR|nr:hypothetical protein BIW11_00355 [Tropilaelaps mercedesae]
MCRSKYGLFAPVHKVAREGGHTTTTVHTTTRTTKVTSPPRLLSRTGSRESVASVASNVSSTSTSSKNSHTAAKQLQRQGLKPRLGVTALAERATTGQQQQQQQSCQQMGTGSSNQSTKIKSLPTSHNSPNQNALQDALREKEEHIEQLLKERDLEQTEIARVTAYREEAEAKLHALQADYAKALRASTAEQDKLRQRLTELEREREELKRRSEDLQFELEELQINKADAEQERKNLIQKIEDLENTLKESANGNNDNVSSQTNLKLVELKAIHRQQVDELKRKIEDIRGELKVARDMRESDNHLHQETEKVVALKQQQLETVDKELYKNKKECEGLRAKVEQLESELFEMAERNQEVRADEIDDLRSKLKENEKKLIEERQSLLKIQKERTDLLAQCDIFESQIKDLQKINHQAREELGKITSGKEQLSAKLQEEIEVLRKKLEDSEKALASEKSFLIKLLDDKEKVEFEFEETRARLEESEKNLASSRNYVEQLEGEKISLQNDLQSLRANIANKEGQAFKEESNAGTLIQDKVAKVEKMRCQPMSKDKEISTLTRGISELTNEKVSLCNELEALRVDLETEKKNSETALKKAELERDSLRFEMENTTSGLKTELDNLRALFDETSTDADGVRKRLTAANVELEKLRTRETRILCDLENAQRTRASAGSEAERLRDDLVNLKNRLAETDRERAESKRELEKETSRSRSLEQKLKHAEMLLTKEKEVAKRRLEDVEERLERSQRMVDSQSNKNHEVLIRLQEEKDIVDREVDQLRRSVRDYQNQLDEAKLNGSKLENANDRLGRELDTLKRLVESTSTEEDRNLERLLAQLEEKRRYEDKIQGELVDAINNSERLRKECADAKKQLEEMKFQVEIKSEQLIQAQESLRKNEVKSKNQVLSFKSQMEGLRNEFDRQEQRDLVEELHRQLSLKETEAQHSESPFDGGVTMSDEDKDSQIDFLNSIIVDMQRKNDEYRARIKIMEATGLAGTKASNSGPTNNEKGQSPAKSILRAPRVFCDICGIFDTHDTENCPRQTSDSIEMSNHSRHGGFKGMSSRPYCDNCETFGHTEDECDIEEF